MPRSDRKKPTLRERAYAYTTRHPRLRLWAGSPEEHPHIETWLAGHRANRLTKAEREVVEAVKTYIQQTMLIQSTVSRTLGWCPECSMKDGKHEAHCAFGPLQAAVSNLERAKAKGGK